MNPTLKTILNALLDAAETRWPSWKGLFELLRPLIAENLPPDGGIIVVGAAPQSITDLIVNLLRKVAAGSNRWLVKIGINALIDVVPGLLNGIWDSIFPNTPVPVMAAAPVEFEAALKAHDVG